MLPTAVTSVLGLDVYVRGCPGMGTRWFERVLPCLFESPVQVFAREKHSGCTIRSASDPNISSKLLHPRCRSSCIHAVIARHPMTLKRRDRHSMLVWEAYYGAWMQMRHANVRFFRFEDLISRGCTATRSDPVIARRYKTFRSDVAPSNAGVWRFWNYSSYAVR